MNGGVIRETDNSLCIMEHQIRNKVDNISAIVPLKAVDTFGSCQRLAFTVDISQHINTITHL